MIRHLLDRKLIVGLFIIFVLFVGIYSFTKMDKELFPPISFDQSMILIETENMPAQDVEMFVSEPIEKVLEDIPGVEQFESSSVVGNSTFMILMEKGKGDEVTKDIEATVQGMQEELHGITDITVMQASMDQPYEFYMDISGESMQIMSDFSLNTLKPRLEALPEVRDVAFAGLEENEIVINLHTEKLAEKGIQHEQIIHTIQEMNKNESIETIEIDANEEVLRWNTMPQSMDDLKSLTIETSEGLIQLDEVADVNKEVSEQKQVAWKNGNPEFVFVQIGRTDQATQIDMASAVRAELENIKQEEGLPGDLEVKEIVAEADYVTNAIDGVAINIVIGGIIAIVVLMLFLRNPRATFIVAISIPSSILLTVLSLGLMDYSFNLATLIGLGLGIGMMVDASIVVLESIYKKKEQGLGNRDAVITGTKEVANAVIASILTTIVVFIPIVILDNEIGEIAFVLALGVALTLLSSLLIAFTLIPVLSENFLKMGKKENRRRRFKKGTFVQKYGQIIKWLTGKKRRRIGVLGLFIIMFISSMSLLVKVPMTLMPDILNRYSEVGVSLEPGVNPDERAEIANEMSDNLMEITDVESNIVMDTVEGLLAFINMTPENEKTMEQREVNEEIARQLRQLEDDYPIASISSAVEGAVAFPIQVEVSGQDYNKLQSIAEQMAEELKTVDGIVTANPETSTLNEELAITLDEEQIKDDNITSDYIYQQIKDMLVKIPIGEFFENGDTTPVFLANNDSINDREMLLKQEIMTPTGEEQLSHYISLEKVESPGQIDRKEGNRFIRVMADIEEQDLGAVSRDIQEVVETFDVDDGYTVKLSGDIEEQQEMAIDLMVVLAISLFLVFVVMAIQFNSLKHPLIILSIIPLTITGVVIGLFLTQKELNAISGIGMIMLIGIVLNNGILLIDRVKQLRNEGFDVNTAMIEAGQDRIRPIFMTTLTTVGGMIPLALATGASSGYQSPLAVVIISGILFSTFITLLLIPSIYLLFEDVGRGLKHLFSRKKKEDELKEEEISS